jgi:hypothetical protein
MPVWAAIIIGLGSGTVGTLLSISHQRGAEFRTRMLEAAVEFVGTAEKLRGVARQPDSLEEALAEYREGWAELVPLVTLLELLFGPSATVTAAKSAGAAFFAVREELERIKSHPEGPHLSIDALLQEATSSLQVFTDVAVREVRASRVERVLLAKWRWNRREAARWAWVTGVAGEAPANAEGAVESSSKRSGPAA